MSSISVLKFKHGVLSLFPLQLCSFHGMSSCNTKMMCINISVMLLPRYSNATSSDNIRNMQDKDRNILTLNITDTYSLSSPLFHHQQTTSYDQNHFPIGNCLLCHHAC